MSADVPRFILEPMPSRHVDVGRWLAILQDGRERTLGALEDLTSAEFEVPPPVGVNTIGTILYHVALTDLNWVYDNLLQAPYPADVANLFPYPMYGDQRYLYPIKGWDKDDYLQRLTAARGKVNEVFVDMDVTEFRALVQRVEDYGTYETTPEAVLRHLAQHEAEHRGEINMLVGGLRNRPR